jgi:CO/xanthine dehydrogenase FAD-binding subunit
MAPALIALNGKLKTSNRTIRAEDFFEVGVTRTIVLDSDEILIEIDIPKPEIDSKSAFLKFAIRKSIDFPIVNCAAMIRRKGDKVKEARICLNAVYVIPYRAKNAEEMILGKEISEENAEAAGDAVVADAKPLKDNGYMVHIARALIKRTLLACK